MSTAHSTDSPYAFARLAVALALATIGATGMYIVPVVLPNVQAEFGVARADAATPYSMLMIGFGVGGLMMGRLADRYGIVAPLFISSVALGLGFALAGTSESIWTFTLAHGLLIGFLGCSAMFAPLIADTSLWFARRRGIAVAICASGNYLGGTIWPGVVQHFVESVGWRHTYFGLGAFCFVAIASLALFMRQRPPTLAAAASTHREAATAMPFGLAPWKGQTLLCIAGVACCVAMSMPQVHIVAYCADLGYGAARGAEMLSVMMGFGIVSRLVSGIVCDRIGGLRTLLLGSFLQGVALLLFLPFDSLMSLYVIAALFGLFQGGIVPSYAIIIREYFPAKDTGMRVGLVMMCTLGGMALGGWMSGRIFDVTGSYHAAFVNGVAWNLLNLTIACTLMWRSQRRVRSTVPA
ncbi:MAG TPA: MFS transporter [Burkholderiales bacterium]|nr:MFS transporter [Burkholderiales bacterium]